MMTISMKVENNINHSFPCTTKYGNDTIFFLASLPSILETYPKSSKAFGWFAIFGSLQSRAYDMIQCDRVQVWENRWDECTVSHVNITLMTTLQISFHRVLTEIPSSWSFLHRKLNQNVTKVKNKRSVSLWHKFQVKPPLTPTIYLRVVLDPAASSVCSASFNGLSLAIPPASSPSSELHRLCCWMLLFVRWTNWLV